MDVFAFFGGVWASIIIGVFIIAMVIGCTFDRHHTESPKWWILLAGIAAFTFWKWKTFTWSGIWASELWTMIMWYLVIGLGYSLIEFMLEVRRSARYWEKTWAEYKKAHREQVARAEKKLRFERAQSGEQVADTIVENQDYGNSLVNDFLSRHAQDRLYNYRIIGVERNEDGGIEPKVNRQQLAENIGCWTFFWPFYAISLIIGDLVTEIFRFVADILVNMSGRFVRFAFKDVFKF